MSVAWEVKMKDKLEPNMYVRTEKNIFKIKKINDEFITIMNTQYVLHHSKFTGHYYFCDDDEVYTIGKTSHNIIDLIEVGDYVNGCKVHNIANCLTIILNNEENISWINPSDIKSIVTKEQFSSMEYRLGDDK